MAREANQIDVKKLTDTVVEKVIAGFNVDEIILFGSYANGTNNELSDVDIAVISPELKPSGIMSKNVKIIKEKTGILEPGLQLFAFESKSFYEEKFFDPSFIREIKKTGKVLYRNKA